MDKSVLLIVGTSIALAILVLCLGLIVRLSKQLHILSARQTEQQGLIESLLQQIKSVRSEVEEAQTRTLVVAKNSEQTDLALTGLQQQLTALAQQEPDTKVYQRAAELLKNGASIEEIMHSCDLPRAEVQLLQHLHHEQ